MRNRRDKIGPRLPPPPLRMLEDSRYSNVTLLITEQPVPRQSRSFVPALRDVECPCSDINLDALAQEQAQLRENPVTSKARQ